MVSVFVWNTHHPWRSSYVVQCSYVLSLTYSRERSKIFPTLSLCWLMTWGMVMWGTMAVQQKHPPWMPWHQAHTASSSPTFTVVHQSVHQHEAPSSLEETTIGTVYGLLTCQDKTVNTNMILDAQQKCLCQHQKLQLQRSSETMAITRPPLASGILVTWSQWKVVIQSGLPPILASMASMCGKWQNV